MPLFKVKWTQLSPDGQQSRMRSQKIVAPGPLTAAMYAVPRPGWQVIMVNVVSLESNKVWNDNSLDANTGVTRSILPSDQPAKLPVSRDDVLELAKWVKRPRGAAPELNPALKIAQRQDGYLEFQVQR